MEAQEQTEIDKNVEVIFNDLSSVSRITVREYYAIEPVKCIYEKLPYPEMNDNANPRSGNSALDGDIVIIRK